MAIQVAKT